MFCRRIFRTAVSWICSVEAEHSVEALSRGAAYAVLVEQNAKAAECIKENLIFTKTMERAEIQKCDVLTALHRMEGQKPFDVIFMDPPYDQGLEEQVLEYLVHSTLADEYTVIVVEASLDTDFSYLEGLGYHVYKEKNIRQISMCSCRKRIKQYDTSDLSGKF